MSLKPADAALLIEQTRSDRTVLIGGQAVAFWIGRFNIESRLDALTQDIDYLGTRADAKRASARLKLRHVLKLATLDDATPNTAVLSIEMEGYPAPVLIDYLAEIIGLTSKDIIRSAITIEFEQESLRVLHPLQLLQSKIWNLYSIREKRSEAGIEQARLAIEIAAAFIREAEMTRRELLKAIEAIAKFAATSPARYVRETYGLVCLKAIPPSVFKEGVLPPAFHDKRWPQLLAAVK